MIGGIMHTFNRIMDQMVKGISIITRLLMIAMIVVVFSAAIGRTLNISFLWSNDLSLLLFAWFCFLAISLASYRQTHPLVDLLIERIPLWAKVPLKLVHFIFIIGFLSIMLVYTIKYAFANRMTTITTLKISFLWVSTSGIVGLTLTTFFEVMHLIKYLIALFTRDNSVKQGA